MKRLAAALCLIVVCAWGEGTGQYSAILEQDPSLPTHTIYRPQDLSAVKEKLPIIAWGNGGCANNGLSHRNFLMEIASHGYLAIAIGPPVAPPARQGGRAWRRAVLLVKGRDPLVRGRHPLDRRQNRRSCSMP